MNPGLIASFFIALIITGVIALLSRRGPWGTVWTLFVVSFLALWTATIYLPFGPVYGGVAWIPIVFVGLVLAFVLALTTPDANHWRDESIAEEKSINEKSGKQSSSLSGVGKVFWIIIIILVIAIIVGMTNPQIAL